MAEDDGPLWALLAVVGIVVLAVMGYVIFIWWLVELS
jgi:hypothetical protein